MEEKKLKLTSTEILHRIDRFCADADWTTEELREDLISRGIDPDEMLQKVKARLAPLYKFKEKEQ